MKLIIEIKLYESDTASAWHNTDFLSTLEFVGSMEVLHRASYSVGATIGDSIGGLLKDAEDKTAQEAEDEPHA